MRKMKVLAGLVFILLLLVAMAAPAAFAQGITGDKVVMGDNFVLKGGETLDGNLAVLGGTAQIDNGATVNGDVSVLGGAVTIDGTVTGNVSLLGGTLRLNESAVVEGNLANFAGSVQRAQGAVVRGNTFSGLRAPSGINPAPVAPTFMIQRETPRGWFSRFINWQLGTIGSLLLMGLLGLVLVVTAPRAISRVASAAAFQPAAAFGIGFLTLIVGLLAGAILLIACGLGLLVWLALVAGSVLGWIGAGFWLGQRLLRGLKTNAPSSIAEVLVGVVLITFLSRLPCIGWLFWIVFVSLGLGAVVLTRFGTQDADRPSGSTARPPAPEGGSGGGFAPLPEASELDLAAPVVVASVVAVTTEPGAVAGEAVPVVAATSERVAPEEPAVPVEPAAIDDTGADVLPEQPAGQLLTDISGIDAAVADRLQAAGIHTVADLAASNPVELAAATGAPVGQILTEDWIGQAQRLA